MDIQQTAHSKDFDYYIERVTKNPELLNRECVVNTIFQLGKIERKFNLVGAKAEYDKWFCKVGNIRQAQYFSRLNYVLSYLP